MPLVLHVQALGSRVVIRTLSPIYLLLLHTVFFPVEAQALSGMPDINREL